MPGCCSGLLTSDGTSIRLEVHLTNDLPVGVTGGGHRWGFCRS